ncbi:nuclear factor related to kappa-B-binding protein-like isoform X2 [Clavelina lepadiformis]|uniref:nuclear factor related to kappa-B-binding protein-like isoform X2 n=1 Tax=Clavelina lepadiformis TaxID=159417 RepID=UPI00404142E7
MTSEVIVDGEVIPLPPAIVENPCILKEVLSVDVWDSLTDEHKSGLHEMLPQSLSEDEKNDTVRTLLSGGNLSAFLTDDSSGNPLDEMIEKMENGYFSPETYQVRKGQRRSLKAKQKFSMAQYYHELLKEIIVSRQCHLAATAYPQLLRLSKSSAISLESMSDLQHDMKLQETSAQMYSNVISEVKQEILATTSYSAADLVSSDEDEDSVPVSKVSKNKLTSTYTMSSHRFKQMLLQHKRRRDANVVSPDLDISGIRLSDVVTRTFGSTKKLPGILAKKRKREETLKLAKQKKLKKKHNYAVNGSKIHCSPSSVNLTKEAKQLRDLSVKTKILPSCYFALIKDVLLLSSDKSLSAIKLLLSDWLTSAEASHCEWTITRPDWYSLADSALKYMQIKHQDANAIEYEAIVQFVDDKWIWKGTKLEITQEAKFLRTLCQMWLQEVVETSQDLKPTEELDSNSFHAQERRRFMYSHQAFVYTINGKRHAVPPVKGSSGPTKEGRVAREHCLLKSERPPEVTLLALTRDAVARLPDGKGTRATVCSFIKDSQYLAPVVTDTQINAAVSGALDRLHYEADPCVRFDASLRLWVYLHGDRTVHDLERIHLQQLETPRKKKASKKSKGKTDDSTAKKSTASTCSVQNTCGNVTRSKEKTMSDITKEQSQDIIKVENLPTSSQEAYPLPNLIPSLVVQEGNIKPLNTKAPSKKRSKKKQTLLELGKINTQVTTSTPAKSGTRTIQLTQKQFLEMTRKLSKTSAPLVPSELVIPNKNQSVNPESKSISVVHQQQGQGGLKLILKPSGSDQQTPSAELVRSEPSTFANAQRMQPNTKQQILTMETLRRLSKQLSAVSNRSIKIVHQPLVVGGKSPSISPRPQGSRVINITTQPEGRISSPSAMVTNLSSTTHNRPVHTTVTKNSSLPAVAVPETVRNILASKNTPNTVHISANSKGEAVFNRHPNRNDIGETSPSSVVHVIRRQETGPFVTKGSKGQTQLMNNNVVIPQNIQVIQGSPQTLQIMSGGKLQTVQVLHAHPPGKSASSDRSQLAPSLQSTGSPVPSSTPTTTNCVNVSQ